MRFDRQQTRDTGAAQKCNSCPPSPIAPGTSSYDGRIRVHMMALLEPPDNQYVREVFRVFGKSIKTSKTYKSAKPLPSLSAPNQEIQFDLASRLIDEKVGKMFILVAVDRFSKYSLDYAN